MAIRNILFSLLIANFIFSCAKLKIKTDKDRSLPTQGSSQEAETPNEEEAVEEPAPLPPNEIPKVAIIFGPGGARTYGGIGFLQAMNKYRIPIHSVGGVEWGSLLAAVYSLKGSINDVEWQLGKIKPDEPMGKMENLKKLFSETLSRFNAEQVKVPFVCPAYNINKNQTYVMNKGPFHQLIPYCLAYPPVYRAYNANVSGIREVKSLAQYLKGQGANYVILVNVLGAPGAQKNITGDLASPENLYWNEIAGFYAKTIQGVDHVINLDADGFTVFDFDKKRDIIQRGATSSGPWVQEFAQKYGF
jgi:NTE family protein